ncbi:hypothetical protein NQZ79_g5185 [Umbelopsis isabellina]|nr:hypothetical protein NQZ79_g5185 [Umbelopsis isabellina]
MNFQINDNQDSPTRLHYLVANISLNKLYSADSPPCLRQHVLIRNLLMRRSFDMILNPAPPPTSPKTVTNTDEDDWLEKCFDDLADTDEDYEDDDSIMSDPHWRPDDQQLVPHGAVTGDGNWLQSYHSHAEKRLDNAVVPRQLPQQIIFVIPYNNMRDNAKEVVGSVKSPEDPISRDTNGSKEKPQVSAPVALIEWNEGTWAIC